MSGQGNIVVMDEQIHAHASGYARERRRAACKIIDLSIIPTSNTF